MPRAVVRLVNIFICMDNDGTIKDVWKVIW
jgi:hypothetical protein